jgi:hypothetical protein
MQCLLGCDGEAGRVGPTPADPWLRHLPQEVWLAPDLHELPVDDIVPILESEQPKAQAALTDTTWQGISVEDARRLLGRDLDSSGSKKLVLLRGLYLEPSHGKFTAYWRDGVVLVRYGCLGRHQVTVIRKAVVATLPDIPREVYVDCEMAQ